MTKSVLQQLRDNERAMRRKLIIEAAKNLFKTCPFHKIGMRTIAAEAGISVASLYQYFPCQDDLFVEILKTDLIVIKKRLWERKTTLVEISTDIVDFFLANEDSFMIMSHFMLRGEKNPEALEKFNKIQEIFLELLDATLTKNNPGSDFSKYSKAFFTAIFGNLITYRNSKYPEDVKYRESLYDRVIITAKAFQIATDSEVDIKATA